MLLHYNIYSLIFINLINFKYIRIENETKPRDLIKFIYSEKGWNLPKPKLIISVTGGTKQFKMPNNMKIAFKRGLIKAAVSTDAWIITCGINDALTRSVGDALAEELDKSELNIPILGIASWGVINMKEKLINQV